MTGETGVTGVLVLPVLPIFPVFLVFPFGGLAPVVGGFCQKITKFLFFLAKVLEVWIFALSLHHQNGTMLGSSSWSRTQDSHS